ncbi:MAG: hypothetical protein V5A46_02150 [Haloferacaceae archaeon]
MGEKKFTLLELHLHDGVEFVGRDLIGGSNDGNAEATEAIPGADESGGDAPSGGSCPGKKVGTLLAIGLAVTLGWLVVRKALGADLDAAEELDDLGE